MLFRRLLRDPLVAFLLAGALLFGAHSWLQSRQPAAVVLNAQVRQGLVDEFVQLTGRQPGSADVERLEREYITDELLLLDAVAQGLHLSDSHIRAQLIQAMRLQVAGLLPEPDDEQLVEHYAGHRERYQAEAGASFEHVYFVARPADSAAILAALQRGEAVPGDGYWQGREFTRYGRSILRGMFGTAFVEALWTAPEGAWAGPWESPRGWHFVRVGERTQATLLPFAQVRDQVANDWLVARIDAAVERHVERSRRHHEVRIE